MMKAPIVDDASQVVEIIRQKSPSAELNLALEHKKPVTTENLPSLEEQEQLQLQEQLHQEEKKDDDRALAAAADDDYPSLLKTASYVEEEGQEALWIDRSIGPAGEPAKRSLFKSKSTNSTPTTPKQLNILLLESQANPPPPPPPPPLRKTDSDADKQREAAQKAETARKLLDQALSVNVGSDGQRELLAQSAFREATDARKLLEKKTSRELDTVLENAKTKGEAAAALARQMQVQEERTVAATITAEEDEEASLRRGPPLKLLEEQVLDSKGSADDHASRARQYLEFILPDVGLRGIPRATQGSQKAKVEKMDDMSTLGFDNTYMDASPTAADPMDILSIGSLNEILDGPMDKSPEKPLASNKDEPKKKRGGFFGGVFRKKTAKEEVPTKSIVNGANEVMKVTGSKAAGKKKAAQKNAEKFAKGSEKEVKRFVATVMVEDGVGKTMEREISNIDELKKYQAVDEQMERQLLEAMSNDDTESLTSHQGVRMHGKQTKPKDKKKSSKGAVEEPDPPQSPPRDYGKNRPTFVSVPQGVPGILMQKSWESLVENEAVPREEIISKAKDAAPRTSERSPKVHPPPPMDDAQAALAPVPSRSPASSVGDMEEDKYTIPPDVEQPKVDDRYAVVGSDCETFEYCWSSCGSGGLKMVRGDSAAKPVPLEPVTSMQRNATEDSDDYSGIPAPIPYDALMTPVAADKIDGKKSPVAPRVLGKLFGRKPKVQGNTSAPKGSAMPESARRSTKGTTAPASMGKSKGATATVPEGKSRRATALESTGKRKGATAPPSTGKTKGVAAPPSAGKANGVSAPVSVFKSNAASRWSSKPSEPASVPAEKAASKSPVKSKTSNRSPKPSPTVKVAPLSSAGNNVKPRNRTSGVFGKRNTKETPPEIQRDTSTIRPVNISVFTTDSPTQSKATNAASFDTRSADENEQDALPLLDQIKEQRNRPRKGLDPVTKDEPIQEQRGIDP
jgi:hypothetical protein